MSKYSVYFILLGIILQYKAEACDPIHLTAEEDVNSFESHDGFQEGIMYEHMAYHCWTIRAPEGYVVQAWTTDFHLELGYDFLNVFCGRYGDEGHIGEYTGTGGIADDSPVHTNDPEMYVEFITDFSIAEDGFNFYYRAVQNESLGRSSCRHDGADVHIHITEHHDHDDDDAGRVIGIIIGIIIILAIVTAVIVGICCCIAAFKKFSLRNQGLRRNPALSNGGVVTMDPNLQQMPQIVFSSNMAGNGTNVGYDQATAQVNLGYLPQYTATEEKVRPPDYEDAGRNTTA